MVTPQPPFPKKSDQARAGNENQKLCQREMIWSNRTRGLVSKSSKFRNKQKNLHHKAPFPIRIYQPSESVSTNPTAENIINLLLDSFGFQKFKMDLTELESRRQ